MVNVNSWNDGGGPGFRALGRCVFSNKYFYTGRRGETSDPTFLEKNNNRCGRNYGCQELIQVFQDRDRKDRSSLPMMTLTLK